MESTKNNKDVMDHLKQIARDRQSKKRVTYSYPLQPPWVVVPDEPPESMAWSMGSGEDYVLMFVKWFKALTVIEQEKYISQNSEPEDWEGYFRDLMLK